MKNKTTFFALLLLVVWPLSALALPVPGVPSGSAALAVRSAISAFHFDADNEAWQMTYVGLPPGATYETLYTNTPALWTPSLGDPAGCIYQTVDGDIDQRAYWLGFIGDHGFMGDLNGLTIQCNVYSTANWQTISSANGGVGGDDGNVYARWVVSRESDSGGTYAMYISTSSVSLDMNSFSGWTTFAVDASEANFIRWPNSPDPGPSFLDVMADYDQIGLYIFSGTDDMADVSGGGTTWFNDGGTSRLQHYGAWSTGGEATWAVDNPTVGSGVVATEATSLDALKALYR